MVDSLSLYRRMEPDEIDMKLPKCCGREMRIDADTGKFLEIVCVSCGDTVYVKKDDSKKPQMLDD